MAETRFALLNSGIPNNQLQVTLAGVVPLSGWEENSAQPDDDFDDFADASQSPGSVIAQERSRLQADIVVVLTDGNYLGGARLGQANFRPGDARKGYAFVEVDAPGKLQVFTHELGHIYGCQHENDVTDYPHVSAYAHPYRWFNPYGNSVPWETSVMMATSNTRQLQFSNPDISYRLPFGGKIRMGRSDKNNARQIRDNALRIPSYVQDRPELEVSISGSSSLRPGQSDTYTANIRNCNQSTTYLWEVSDGSTSGYRRVGTGSSLNFQASDVFVHSLRLTVNCGSERRVRHLSIFVGGGDGCGRDIPCLTQGPLTERAVEFSEEIYVEVNPYPNPADESFEVRIPPSRSTTKIQLVSLITRGIVFESSVPASGIGRNFNLKTDKLPQGSYTLRLKSADYVTSTPIEVLR